MFSLQSKQFGVLFLSGTRKDNGSNTFSYIQIDKESEKWVFDEKDWIPSFAYQAWP